MAKQITKAEKDAALKVVREYGLQQARIAAKKGYRKGKALAKAGAARAGAATKKAGKGLIGWLYK